MCTLISVVKCICFKVKVFILNVYFNFDLCDVELKIDN